MDIPFETLKDKIITSINLTDEEILFNTDKGRFLLYHKYDCCEDIHIDDICGSPNDLIGYPIISALKISSESHYIENGDSATWTFYKLDTEKGGITIRWVGQSNGCYSEEVNFKQLDV